jgi:hypothetical protein
MVTQRPSQTSLQQNGSTAQTVLQQAPSAQRGVPCSWKQLPESGSPQVSQTEDARIAHCSSHATLQQYANAASAQTWLQHPGRSQPGVRWGTKQLPSTGRPVTGSRHAAFVAQVSVAMLRQERSQLTAQQYGSRWHTSWQQNGSEHPGVACTAKQLPAVGWPHAQFFAAHEGFTSASCVQPRSHDVSQQ